LGLLDNLFGRTKPVRPNLDALFALPSAAVTLQTAAGLVVAPKAGICWKPPAGKAAEDVRREISELLSIPDDATETPPPATPAVRESTDTPLPTAHPETDTAAIPPSATPPEGETTEPPPPLMSGVDVGQLTQVEDSYGYQWLLLDDPEVDNLVTRVHLVNATLNDNGWGPQLLCSVFGLTPTADADPETKALFLVYLFKRGTFYPFAPDGKEHRDSELELRVRAFAGSDLPVEPDLSRWFPLWDMPLT